MSFALEHSYLIPLFPLIAAAIAGFFGKRVLGQQSHWPIWLGVGASAVLSLSILFAAVHQPTVNRIEWGTWFTAGDQNAATPALGGIFNVAWSALIDPLTAVMLSVVCGIGFLITVFAAGYMKGESGYWRFFAYLGLFIFAMTCLVMSDSLVGLYLGWEGVGLCSYLLIGYYFDKPKAREAAKKAFLVNRVGDFGFAIGIILVWYCFQTTSITEILTRAHAYFTGDIANAMIRAGSEHLIYWIPFCLMLGAFGKSAQFPLHVWLPDAMEGPTPVSALIHAATMVTAGVYMIARLGPLFVGNHAAMLTIAVIGAFTAIFAASIAMRQFDLKKVFAYSTVSQLGYMFVAVGVMAPVAGVFHLVTHAFFKALLFLSSGVVMHAMLGHLDLRKMSGIKRQLPITRIVFLIGCAALAGFPLLSGFWSKDEIIAAAGQQSWILYGVLTLTSLLTAYYTFRVYFRVFEGPELIPTAPADEDAPDVEHAAASMHVGEGERAHELAGVHGHTHGHAHHDDHHHNHEPLVMILPLLILAIGALAAGIINLPFNVGTGTHGLAEFLGHSPSFSYAYDVARHFTTTPVEHLAANFGQPVEGEHAESFLPLLVGAIVSILGIAGAYFNHLADRRRGEELAGKFGSLTTVLEGKYWIDQLYQGLIVMPLRGIGMLFSAIDRFVVDGIVSLVAVSNWLVGFVMRGATQRGFLQGYALTGVLGIAVILWIVFYT